MQAGIKLPQFGANANADEMRRWAVFAEAVGYHFVLTGDHIALTPEVLQDYPAPYYEPFTTMAWLAGQTTTIRLGFTVIVVPYRHPAQLAHMGANDRRSKRRPVDIRRGFRVGRFGIRCAWYSVRSAWAYDRRIPGGHDRTLDKRKCVI